MLCGWGCAIAVHPGGVTFSEEWKTGVFIDRPVCGRGNEEFGKGERDRNDRVLWLPHS